MRKMMSIPVLVLIAAVAVACGKSKGNQSPVAVAPAPVDVGVPPPVTPPPTGVDMSAWCYHKGGTLLSAQSICQFTDTIGFNWNQYYGTIDTKILIYAYDTVSVRVDGSHKNYVGGILYPDEFVSQSNGSLIIKGSRFEIRTVKITRCINSSGHAVVCQ